MCSLDVALGLLPQPVPAALAPRRPVFLGRARRLFPVCSPVSTRVLWHGDSQFFALSDAASLEDEDGANPDRIFLNGASGGGTTPQWVRDEEVRRAAPNVAHTALPRCACARRRALVRKALCAAVDIGQRQSQSCR